MKKNISKGPMLPLAILAMFVLLVPIFFVSNSQSKPTNAQAAFKRVAVPTHEPVVEMNDMDPMKPSTEPTATPKSYPVRTSSPVNY